MTEQTNTEQENKLKIEFENYRELFKNEMFGFIAFKEIKEKLLNEIIKDLDVIAFSVNKNRLGNQKTKDSLYFHIIGKKNKYIEEREVLKE